MFVLVGNIITSLLGALLISVVAVIVLLLIIHWLFPDYLAGSILFSAFLSIVLMAVIGVQAFLGLGASKVKEYVVSAEQSLMTVAQVIQQTKDPQERQTAIQNILEEEVPLGGKKTGEKIHRPVGCGASEPAAGSPGSRNQVIPFGLYRTALDLGNRSLAVGCGCIGL